MVVGGGGWLGCWLKEMNTNGCQKRMEDVKTRIEERRNKGKGCETKGGKKGIKRGGERKRMQDNAGKERGIKRGG